MHPALIRLIHLLAECEADRLCAPDASDEKDSSEMDEGEDQDAAA